MLILSARLPAVLVGGRPAALGRGMSVTEESSVVGVEKLLA
ncbi:hypothetical protein [Streptomyces sp. NPDC059861]